jgi:hypothetical protein
VSQTRFTFHQCSPEKKEKLDQKLSEIYDNIKSRFKFFGTFQDVLTKASGYSSADLKDEQEPEEFAKRQLIEPLIEIMGYEIVPETVLSSPAGRKKPDYQSDPRIKMNLYSMLKQNHSTKTFMLMAVVFGKSETGCCPEPQRLIMVSLLMASNG